MTKKKLKRIKVSNVLVFVCIGVLTFLQFNQQLLESYSPTSYYKSLSYHYDNHDASSLNNNETTLNINNDVAVTGNNNNNNNNQIMQQQQKRQRQQRQEEEESLITTALTTTNTNTNTNDTSSYQQQRQQQQKQQQQQDNDEEIQKKQQQQQESNVVLIQNNNNQEQSKKQQHEQQKEIIIMEDDVDNDDDVPVIKNFTSKSNSITTTTTTTTTTTYSNNINNTNDSANNIINNSSHPSHYHHQQQQLMAHHHRNNNNNNNDKDNKPYIVIHIGPPKTGTTTLQDSFRQLQDQGNIWSQDSYEYGHQVVYDIMNIKCHKQLYQLRKSYFANNTTTTKNNPKGLQSYTIPKSELITKLKQDIPCWNQTLLKLEPFFNKRKTTNLFASAEPWAVDYNRIWTEYGHSLVDWTTIYWTIMSNFNILLVFAYRRYPEWIFSNHQQINRYKHHKPNLGKWPTLPSLPKSKNNGTTTPDEQQQQQGPKKKKKNIITGGGTGVGGGKKVKPIYPLPSEVKSITYRYTDHILKEMQNHPFVEYKIFNMHDLRSSPTGGLVSSFICYILPNATNSCQYSLEKEQQQEQQLQQQQQQQQQQQSGDSEGDGDSNNSTTTQSTITKTNNATTTTGDNNTTTPNAVATIIRNPSQSLFYDALAIAAYEKGWIDPTKYKRHHVVVDNIQNYWTNTLNLKPNDFPLVCPPQNQYEQFLNLSLSLETQILGKEFAKTTEMEHRQQYWEQVQKKKFCWIDTESTLLNSTTKGVDWNVFFQQFSFNSTPPTPITKNTKKFTQIFTKKKQREQQMQQNHHHHQSTKLLTKKEFREQQQRQQQKQQQQQQQQQQPQ